MSVEKKKVDSSRLVAKYVRTLRCYNTKRKFETNVRELNVKGINILVGTSPKYRRRNKNP